MSKPRPIHTLHRNLRETPDEGEPSFSYEDHLFDRKYEDDEDKFHRRLQSSSHRRDSNDRSGASSLWRTSSIETNGTPSLQSVSIRAGGTSHSNDSPSLLTQAMQTPKNKSSAASRDAPGSGKKKHSGGTPQQWNQNADIRRHDSSMSENSSNSVRKSIADNKKKIRKGRAAERDRKLNAQSSDIDIGHIVDHHDDDEAVEDVFIDTTTSALSPSLPTNFEEMRNSTSSAMDRSSSDQSTGSLLYCKTPSTGTGPGAHGYATTGVLGNSSLGKSSSLIFPTGVDSVGGANVRQDSESSKQKKRRKINLSLDQCESIRFPFKKKLILEKMDLNASDIPLKDLCGTTLGNSLHKLSLSGNRLGSVPPKLVQSFPVLRTLDLSQCELHQLPDHWNLPKLMRLNLSHNRFTEFPEETMLEGLPELQELNMYGNKVAEITIPTNSKLLSKLETLDMGYNDLLFLPDELDQFKALRVLKLMNNFLAKVPMRVCDMDLKLIDVSSNPVTEPPIETCERGICSMRRYWHCIRMEEQSKKRALAEVQKKLQRQTRKSYKTFMSAMKMGSVKESPSALRKASSSSGGSVADASTSSAPAAFSSSAASTLKSSFSSVDAEEKPQARAASVPENEQVEAKMSASVPETAMAALSVVDDVIKPATFSLAETWVSSPESVTGPAESLSLGSLLDDSVNDKVTVNDTLKVIFVGMAMVGKTSMIKRLIEGRDAVVPTRDERTVGVDIYDWEPKNDTRFSHIDSRIDFQDKQLAELCGDVDVKLSVWDFAGQHVYHATHELFFSNRALYVLVWDMGATNTATLRRKTSSMTGETGAFKLSYDSSDEEDEESDVDADLAAEEEERRADRALEHDIDEKVQFWVDCIQSTAPGSVILPVVSFDDAFDEKRGGVLEAKRRCNVLKQRLLMHEERRINGIKARLQEFHDQNRADDIAAIRLRKLLCQYTRPKLIFSDDDDNPVVRVSGTEYTGFDKLTEKIIGIATGQNKCQMRYPMFHGHVGARIPRMRLEVREAVRRMRSRFKVVEWGYFVNVLRDHGLTNVEDISDALHFLTNTGELSYFGGVMSGSELPRNSLRDAKNDPNTGQAICSNNATDAAVRSNSFDDDDDVDEEELTLSIDDTSITAPSTTDGSLTSLEDFTSSGLSQFIFLNPRWLVAAVACILRHDLDREIKETRRLAATGGKHVLSRTASFYDARLNCPVITAEDACLLWQYKRITKKAAERAQQHSNNMTVTPFEFLQLLLTRFGVFVPIDLSIEKAYFGGKEYKQLVEEMNCDVSPQAAPVYVTTDDGSSEQSPKFFFLPSLLGPSEPSEAWSYKSSDAYKTTLCHSILFPDGVPPGLMERLTASVLSAIYAISKRGDGDLNAAPQDGATYEGRLSVKEVFCWRTAFYLKIGSQVASADGDKGKPKESVVEIFTHLAGRESRLCVGSDFMGVGMRRLIASGRGQASDGGHKIWKGGYLLVIKCIMRVMATYEGLEYEKQGFCPVCLAKKAVSEAGSWDAPTIRATAKNSELSMRCRHGHRVDTRLLAGGFANIQQLEPKFVGAGAENVGVSVKALAGAVVIIGLWDGETRRVARVGSGFIADRKRGLIVTAAHTLMSIWDDRNYPYGEDYYGKKLGRVVIGVIPRDGEGAVFRYFAQIVSKDPNLDHGMCHVDACVLRITTRMENDVGGDGEGCGDQPEILLLHDERALKKEQLPTLKMTEKCELEEEVRIVGYNQGGGGLLGPGEKLNRYIDFAKGYVCMQFVNEDVTDSKQRQRFKPRQEIVAICPTIGGHSGGPCVNQQGEVIGILSRADSLPAQNGRCYLVPATELKKLVSKAKKSL